MGLNLAYDNILNTLMACPIIMPVVKGEEEFKHKSCDLHDYMHFSHHFHICVKYSHFGDVKVLISKNPNIGYEKVYQTN